MPQRPGAGMPAQKSNAPQTIIIKKRPAEAFGSGRDVCNSYPASPTYRPRHETSHQRRSPNRSLINLRGPKKHDAVLHNGEINDETTHGAPRNTRRTLLLYDRHGRSSSTQNCYLADPPAPTSGTAPPTPYDIGGSQRVSRDNKTPKGIFRTYTEDAVRTTSPQPSDHESDSGSAVYIGRHSQRRPRCRSGNIRQAYKNDKREAWPGDRESYEHHGSPVYHCDLESEDPINDCRPESPLVPPELASFSPTRSSFQVTPSSKSQKSNDPQFGEAFSYTVFYDFLRNASGRYGEEIFKNPALQPFFNERPLAVTLKELFTGIHKKVQIRQRTRDGATRFKTLEMNIIPGTKRGARVMYRRWGNFEDGFGGYYPDLHFVIEEVRPLPMRNISPYGSTKNPQ